MADVSFLNSMFAYSTPKRVKVQYWQLGVFYYAACGTVVAFYGSSMFSAGEYLKRVPVHGTVNPFAATTSHPSKTCEASGTCGTVGAQLLNKPYCAATDHHFIYSSDFKYQSGANSARGPLCREDSLYQINSKTQNYITFSSVYTETQIFGWALADDSGAFATAAKATCDAGTAGPKAGFPNQMECTSSKAIFPAEVEQYTVYMQHTYNVENLLDKTWSGSSEFASREFPNHPVDTTVLWNNGSSTTFYGGEDIAVSVQELLKMAGIDLNDRNMDVPAEDGDPSNHPTYRHTGVELVVTLEYTNRQGEDMMIGAVNQDVDVTVPTPEAPVGWKSVGPKTYYPVYPIGALGSQQYHQVIHYPQDIEIKFRSTGYAYAFDYLHAVQTLLDLFVLVAIARTLTDFIVFYCIPNVSIVLRNKRDEATSRSAAFRELGMRAAISVNQFHRINEDIKRPNVVLSDLVKVFGTVQGVSKEQAVNIAQTVLSRKTKKELTFNDFMEITEGSTIPFDKFLDLVAYTAAHAELDKVSQDELQKATRAYDEEEAKAANGIILEQAPAPPTPPQQPAGVMPQQQIVVQQPAPPPGVIKLSCGNCRQTFGVPAGATMVKCPFCGALNNTAGARQAM